MKGFGHFCFFFPGFLYKKLKWKLLLYQNRRDQLNSIFEITQEAARCIVDSGSDTGKYEPAGLFWLVEESKYVGIDNSGGGAFFEEFDSKLECFCWLLGDYEIGELQAWKKCGRLHGFKMALFSLNGLRRFRLPQKFTS